MKKKPGLRLLLGGGAPRTDAQVARVMDEIWDLLGSNHNLPTFGLLRLKESALILGLKPETLRRQIRQGQVRAVRLGEGGNWRLRRVDVLRLLVEQWVEPAPQSAVDQVRLVTLPPIP